ncbi:MAG TPA: hypothetical protein VF347_01350 [Candidatus Humimicrobiaceae bacterium]
MIFKRKKVERPKNRLGLALLKYDGIWNLELHKIMQSIKQKKAINSARADIVFDDVFYKLDAIAEDISRENFKTDYRSDKTRDSILELIGDLKALLQHLISNSFDFTSPLLASADAKISRLIADRQSLKSKMKDIESDYQ